MLYDPKLHRFLQPDNYVQDPSNTQNFNRYAYVLNNPLKYIDPSGEKITWSDIVSGISIVGGAILSFIPGLAVIGVPLVAAGITHFATAVNEFQKTGDWTSASNNAGFIVSIKIDTDDLFGGKKDKNGVTQNESVVKPKSDTNGGGKGKEDDSFYPGQYLPNFKSDIGFDVFKFKGLHYGVPEFESSWMDGKGAITPGPFVIYPTGGSSRKTYNTHEGGHFVQFLALGSAYYPLIAIPSIINTQLNWKIFDYTEKTANDLWYWWSGESSNLNKGYRK